MPVSQTFDLTDLENQTFTVLRDGHRRPHTPASPDPETTIGIRKDATMSEILVRLAKEWREAGGALVASHPANSEHGAIGRTLLRCARELEFALRSTPVRQ